MLNMLKNMSQVFDFEQTHNNLEHMAMMQRILGPLPAHMIRKTRCVYVRCYYCLSFHRFSKFAIRLIDNSYHVWYAIVLYQEWENLFHF